MEGESQRKRSRSKSAERGSSRERARRRRTRSRSRSRNVRRSRSRSISPLRPGWSGGFRGGRRFNRRSPPFRGGRGFRGGFRRSRSTSRGRFDRRRYDEHDHRRSRSASPNRTNNNNDYAQQQQAAAMGYGTEAYGNYLPQFPGSMAQFNTYDFQASYVPPAPNFNMPMGMDVTCPAPPGMNDWQPPQAQMPSEPEEEKLRREAAIAEEKKRQREGLKKQRDQYISRSEKMKRELKMLKEQKSGLLDGLGKRSPSPKTNGFIKENDKLQWNAQISSKLSEILNVIDMLTGIIGKDEEEEQRKESDSDSSPERIKSKLLESMKGKKKENEEKKQKINFIYYDPELHWCKPCQAFPKTAQEYLNHLHSKEHLEKIANRATEAPWRIGFQKINEVPSYPDAPTKRAPIKGLQFFEPASAWFCKLCEMFMGDSWCTSLHLKSAIHAERYAKFIEKEPKFEEKWLEARNKAFENFGCLDSIVEQHQKASVVAPQESSDKKLLDKKKKKKNKKDGKKKRKRGKKRKHSSSSSDSDDDSDSSSSTNSDHKKDDNDNKNSIRVAMRNMLKKGGQAENEKTGWTMVSLDPNKPPIPPPPAISLNASKETKKEEQIINQWNTVEPIISQEEKRLLENLKGRYKQNKAENEKAIVPPPPIVSLRRKSRDRSRSKERRPERNFRNRKSRSRSRNSPRRRSNSRDRRRSNSRDRRRSPPRYGRRYSRSRSRSPRFSRPQISFPTEPRLPPLREEKKQPARSYVITKKEEPAATATALANASRKMPIIGKMPVFKRIQPTEKKSEIQPEEEEKREEIHVNSAESLELKNREEDWNDLMPDPEQFSAMMNSAQPADNQEQPDAPPGMDPEMDSEFIPKPISDAPVMRKGPLPKDFQATLDILFDGDSIKPVVMEQPVPEAPLPVAMPIDIDGPQMIMAEELSQHALLYGNYDIQPVPAPPEISKKKTDIEIDKNSSAEVDDEKMKNQEDLDDLAMLGIDVNDVGSGLW